MRLPEELVRVFFENDDKRTAQATHAVLPFINGLTERYDNGTELADIYNEIVLIRDNMNVLTCT